MLILPSASHLACTDQGGQVEKVQKPQKAPSAVMSRNATEVNSNCDMLGIADDDLGDSDNSIDELSLSAAKANHSEGEQGEGGNSTRHTTMGTANTGAKPSDCQTPPPSRTPSSNPKPSTSRPPLPSAGSGHEPGHR